MSQTQLLNQQQQTPLIQNMNALDYPSFQMLRMTQPQLHQPTLASPKEDNAPTRVTRPPNAYLLFNKKMRRILKEQDPKMNEEKDTYLNEAKRLKEEQRALHPNSMYMRRSKAELKEAGKIVSKEPIDKKTHKKNKKKAKNPGIPKHPLSAYMWYLNQVRPKTMKMFPRSNVGQISKYCAEKWYTMTEEEREPWKSKAQIDKERYAREMQLYAIQNDHELGRGTRQKYRHAIVTAAAAAASVNHTDYLLENSLFNTVIPLPIQGFCEKNHGL